MKLCAKRIMNHAPRPTARPSRARIAMCDSNGKCVTGSYFISVTQLPYIFQSLTPMCDMCDMCDSFSEFILELVQNTVLFLKKNFNLKTPGTAGTALETLAITHFLPVSTWYTRWYSLVQTPSYLVHTKNIELNVSHKSRISNTMSTNHGNRLTLRVHRSFWRSL